MLMVNSFFKGKTLYYYFKATLIQDYISIVVDVHVCRAGELIGLVLESWVLVRELQPFLSQGLAHGLVLLQRDPEQGGSTNTRSLSSHWFYSVSVSCSHTYLTIPSASTTHTRTATRHFMIPPVQFWMDTAESGSAQAFYNVHVWSHISHTVIKNSAVSGQTR